MKRNALTAATEACCLILSIDETIKNPQSEQPKAPSARMRGAAAAAGRAMFGRGRGRGMMRR